MLLYRISSFLARLYLTLVENALKNKKEDRYKYIPQLVYCFQAITLSASYFSRDFLVAYRTNCNARRDFAKKKLERPEVMTQHRAEACNRRENIIS